MTDDMSRNEASPMLARGHRCLLNRLASMGKTTFPEFAIGDFAPENEHRVFDLSSYARDKEVYTARITKHLGWPVRSLIEKQTLEFYQLYRYLSFQKAKALLRESVLSELNRILQRIGRKMSFSAKIVLESAPSSAEFEDYIAELIAGKLPFKRIPEIMKN